MHQMWFINKNSAQIITNSLEELFKLVHGIDWILDGVSNDGGMIENFEIVPALCSFIPEKVNFTEIERFQVAQTESLVPALREGVNRNLTTDRILQPEIREFRFEGLDKIGADRVSFVVSFKFQAFLVGAITSDWGNVDHGITEFDKTSTLDGNIQIGNVTQGEINQSLILFLTQEYNEALLK